MLVIIFSGSCLVVVGLVGGGGGLRVLVGVDGLNQKKKKTKFHLF